MDTQKLHFITKEFTQKLSVLSADAPAKWGKMNSQQMIEHVANIFKVSHGKLFFPLLTPIEQLPRYKEFLLSDSEFRENTKAPLGVVPEEPLPLKYNSLTEAVNELQAAINDFVKYFNEHPETKTMHPAFGELYFDEWVLFHYKHAIHHSKQFGIL